MIDVSELRTLLGYFENPIQHLSSAGLEQLHRVTDFDPLDFAAKRVWLLLERHDIDVLRDYLQKRLELARVHKSLTDRLTALNSTSAEIIQMIDMKWIRPNLGNDDVDGDDNEA